MLCLLCHLSVWSNFSFLSTLPLHLPLQIEEIVNRIQDETEGVPIRTVKSFMTKIPSVVTGKQCKKKEMSKINRDKPNNVQILPVMHRWWPVVCAWWWWVKEKCRKYWDVPFPDTLFDILSLYCATRNQPKSEAICEASFHMRHHHHQLLL